MTQLNKALTTSAAFAMCMLLHASAAFSQDALFSLHNTKLYAEHLYNTTRYKEAAEQYELIVFHEPDFEKPLVRLFDSYRKSGQIDIGIKRFNKLIPDPYNTTGQLQECFAKLLIEKGYFQDVIDFVADPKTHFSVEYGGQLSAYCHIMLLEIPEAKQSLKVLSANDNVRNDFENLVKKHVPFVHRSPFLAGAFSTVVPGLGKVYTGNWKDGLISFVFVATSVWQGYSGFNRNGIQSIYGWIFTAIGTGFYLGNIYGSVKEAQKFNNSQKNQLLADATAVYMHYFH